MAKSIKIKGDMTHHYTFTSPFGNCTSRTHQLSTAATTGIVNNSVEKTAIEAGDKVILGFLPEGFCLTDATLFVIKPLTGTASLGFEYTDGIDHPDVPQNPKYFFADKDVSTAVRIRADGTRMDVLPKPANLILTCAAANTKESLVRAAIIGELVGNE